jgi:hypothetical protein
MSPSKCCSDGDGYCKQGYACVEDGCCPFGKLCDGRIICDFGEVPCGDKHCMPDWTVCCPGESYCRTEEECFQNGFEHYCQRAESATAEETKTDSIAKPASSHEQRTTNEVASTRTNYKEITVSVSTSISTFMATFSSKTTSSELETNKPVVLPTPHLFSKSSTLSSVEAQSATSSHAPEPTASASNNDAVTAVKIPSLKFTLALALVLMAVIQYVENGSLLLMPVKF